MPETAGEAVAAYLHAQASEFLRSLRLHRESGADAEETVEAARQLRRSARRISGALHAYRPLMDVAWADPLRAELTWLSTTLAREHAYSARLERLRAALHRLSGADTGSGPLGVTGGRDELFTEDGVFTGEPGDGGTDGGDGLLGAGPGGTPGVSEGPALNGTAADPAVTEDAGQGGRGARGVRTGPRAARTAEGAPPADGSPAVDSVAARNRERERGRERQRVAAARSTAPHPAVTAGAAGKSGAVGPQRKSGQGASPAAGALTVGAARAGALLERQLTLARTRAHSAALQALGSSRFHAVADAVAVLASEVPLDRAAADRPAADALPPLVDQVHRRLLEAVEGLPLWRAGHPYNAEALVHGLAATGAADAPPAAERQDAPWHQVRLLVRLRRYAQEVLDGAGAASDVSSPEEETTPLSVRLMAAAQALDRHRDASEAAAAAAAAARTPRIAPATAYALGVLHADQRHDVEAARFAFGRLWQQLAVR